MHKSDYNRTKNIAIKVFILFISILIVLGTLFMKPNINWPPKIPNTTLNIKQPFLKETVPMKILGIVLESVYLILTTIFIVSYKLDLRRVLILVDFLVCSHIFYSLLLIVFQIIKLYFAKPRPNFLAVCDPDSYGFCDISTPHQIKKIYYVLTSFPSGHSATITYFGLLLILVLATQPISIILKQSLGNKGYYISCGFSIIVILLSIVLVCLSRIWDYYHRIIDVSVGVLLGIVFVGIMIPLKNRIFREYFK